MAVAVEAVGLTPAQAQPAALLFLVGLAELAALPEELR